MEMELSNFAWPPFFHRTWTLVVFKTKTVALIIV